MVSERKISSRLMRIGLNSRNPQPLVTTARARSGAGCPGPALRSRPRSRLRAVAPLGLERRSLMPGMRCSVLVASAPAASICTYIVSEPRSRDVRLSGVSMATTRPLLMMTTRWHVCRNFRSDVGAQDDGVIARQRLDELADLDDLLRVEPGGRLVEDEDVRVVDQRLREADALLVALGELRAEAVGLCRMTLRAIHDGADPRLRCSRERHAFDLGHERQVFRDCHVRIKRRRLRQVARAALRTRSAARRRRSRRRSPCLRWPAYTTGQDPHRRGLAGAVRTEEAQDLAALDAESLTSLTAVTGPYRFVRCWTSITSRPLFLSSFPE